MTYSISADVLTSPSLNIETASVHEGESSLIPDCAATPGVNGDLHVIVGFNHWYG